MSLRCSSATDGKKNCEDADVAQSVERILGKDEVTSSNLVISSINPVDIGWVFVLPLKHDLRH